LIGREESQEGRIGGEKGGERVGPAGLDGLPSGQTVAANPLVHGLAVGAGADELHEQPLGGGKGAVDGQVAGDGPVVDYETVDQAQAADQYLVGNEERLGQDEATVGRIVEGALQE